MAHVMQPAHIEFPAAPVNHSPSPFGFGFGLSSNPTPFGYSNNGHGASGSGAPFQQLSSAINQVSGPSPSRLQKRRHEPEDESENTRDVSMGRSPTPPDRPKKSAPKRLKAIVDDGTLKADRGKEKSHDAQDGEDEVDVGVLLATLPSTALLPILNSLLQTHPSLKPLVVSLIPRPTVDTAIQALNQSAKKLRDAYPYSNASPSHSSTHTPTPTPTSFAFGVTHRPSGFDATTTGFGFGRLHGTDPLFGHQTAVHHSQGMRDDYIVSRLRPYISEFISTCFTYLPYFTYATDTSHAATPGSRASSGKDKPHPNEVFQFLAAITGHLLAQPPLAQTALTDQMLLRLIAEWGAWVDRVDAAVNREGGMFSGEVARGWERTLDELAQAKGSGLEVLVQLRDRWVNSVGWLVGRARPMMLH